MLKCLILGGGPAGYTAAIYAARASLAPVVIEGPEPGGQLTTTSVVENFPGFPEGVDPFTLTDNMKKQAVRFGADVRRGVVTAVELGQRPFRVTLDGGEVLESETLIVATGASASWLGLPSEQQFRGSGVSACATCDGFFYRGKDVAVVGGGDTACEEASYLSNICRKVHMIVRRDVLRASAAMRSRVENAPNIEIHYLCQTKEVLGDNSGVTGARLLRTDGTVFDITIDGFFVAIGHRPASELFAGALERDAQGYIITYDGTSRTSVEGVFAAGDVQDPRYRQAITAAASGCRAALDAEKFLLEKNND